MLPIRQRGLSRTSPSGVRGRVIVRRCTSSAVTCPAGSLAGGTIDRLTQQVSVAVVPGVLLDHVEVEPAHVALVRAVMMLRPAGGDVVERLAGDGVPCRGAVALV